MLSFLIIKTSAIGDVIQTFPVLEYLKKFPDARIDWVVEKSCHDLVKSHPYLNHVYCIDTKIWRKTLTHLKTLSEIRDFYRIFSLHRYDALFDLQGNTKSALITMMAKAKEKIGFGFRSAPEKTNTLVTTRRFDVPANLNARLRYLTLVQKQFKDPVTFNAKGIVLGINDQEKRRLNAVLTHPHLTARPLYMVSFGSKWQNKCLDAKTLKSFLGQIDHAFKPSFVFIWGNEAEKMIAEDLQSHFFGNSLAVGDLSLSLWQNLMSKMDLVIATDSAGLHLADTAGAPTFSVFGPSAAAVYKPIGDQHWAFQGNCPYGLKFEKRCPKLRTCPTGACIRSLPVQELFESFKTWSSTLASVVRS